ncbi:MAG: peptidase M19 [Rhodobacterales bacterium]|nr:MAG: peptidase M19 [Rhodobacterales bacterium]
MRTFGKWLGRLLLVLIVGIVAVLIFAPGYIERERNIVAPHDPFEISQAAAALHADLFIGDWHVDPLLWKRDLNERGSRGHVDVPRMFEGNVALQVFTAVTKSPAGQNYEENSADARDNITLLALLQLWPVSTWNSLTERALYQAEKLHTFAAASDGKLRVITTAAELDQFVADRAAGQKVVAGILGIEGAHPLEGDMANLDRLVAAGYRVIGLQHFFDNELGGSLHGIGNQGLTEFGRAVVREVAARGLVLDVAHSSPQVVDDVLAITDMPIVVSHTGIYSHCQTPRNLQNEQMQRIVARGGVVGIGFWADAVCDDSPDGVAGAIKAAVDLLGEDHVSLGSDYDGSVPTGFDVSEMPALTDALLRVGLSETQIRKVMGENMLRVLRARLGG